MADFFKSDKEFFDLVDQAREAKKRGAKRIVVHGSTVSSSGSGHEDIDVYNEYPTETAEKLAKKYPKLGKTSSIHIEDGKRSKTYFDINETDVPFEESDLGGVDKPKRVIYKK